MPRRLGLLLLMILLATLPLSAESEGDFVMPPEQSQPPVEPDAQTSSYSTTEGSWPIAGTESSTGLLEGMATSDGFFALSYMPDFSIGKFTFQFDVKIKGSYETEPFGLALDFSDWEAPARDEGESLGDYTIDVFKHYSRFIRTIQYGERYDSLYVRFGKLLGITLGDGALVNGYFDRSVSVRNSRPGLELMVDAMLLGIPNAGFEFITNDVFKPTLTAWRIFSRPLGGYPEYESVAALQIGLSFAQSPASPDEQEGQLLGRKLVALDISLPVITWNWFNVDFFTDFIAQTPDREESQPAFAYRYGLWGHTKSFFIFNASVTVPFFGRYYAEYFSSDFENRSAEDLDELVIEEGTTRLDAMFGLNFVREGVYLRAKMVSNYSYGDYHDYRFLANARIDKRLFNIVSLDLSYEKLYPTTTGERFLEGLQTLKNVILSASAVVKVKPYSFDLGLSILFDEQAHATYTLDTAVRISIL
ncbi:MAG TPA: hypothetical protein PLQ90_03040 [Sphaerochaeta sp.]|nr:hypothetical protein [Sphaerochaeta sp.]